MSYANRQARDAQADAMLAKLSEEQLRDGLAKARKMLALNEVFEQEGPADSMDGPFPASKAYEQWATNDCASRDVAYTMAAQAVEQELIRRGLSPNGSGGQS